MSDFQLQREFPNLELIKVKSVGGVVVLLARNTVTGEGEIWWDNNIGNWQQATVLNASGAVFTDIDYGNGQYIVSTDDPGGRMWYSDERNPTRFYYGVSTSMPSYRSHFVEYGGGLSYEWLSASKNTSTIAVSDAAPKYNGVLMPDSLGADSILVGEYTDTYYDSTGLQSRTEPLYQFIDSDRLSQALDTRFKAGTI